MPRRACGEGADRVIAVLAMSLWAASQEPRTPPVALVVPVETIADPLAVDLALIGAGTGLDLITTDYALSRGCVEANPLIPRVEGRVAMKMGAGALRGAIAYWLRRRGHSKVAGVLRWFGAAADFGISVNNVVCGVRKR